MVLRVLAVIAWTYGTLAAVVPVPIGDLLYAPARPFDLSYQSVTFRRTSDGGYRWTTTRTTSLSQPGLRLKLADSTEGKAWLIRLPFGFPIGGQTWTEAYVNLNGTLTFGMPQADLYPQRETWSDGTMRAMAAGLYLKSVEGRCLTIAPLWAMYSADRARVSTRILPSRAVITWDVERYQSLYEGYAPLGRNTFQLAISADGAVEFRYGAVAEKDGIAGIFAGAESHGRRVSPNLRDYENHIEAEGLKEAFLISGNEGFRLRPGGTSCFFIQAHSGSPTDCSVPTRALPDGRLLLPKAGLRPGKALELLVGGQRQPVQVRHTQQDLSRQGSGQASVFEVFRYPIVPKARPQAFHHIYKAVPKTDDLALAFTDFRIDDIHNHGGSNRSDEDPRLNGEILFGSARLQNCAGPVYPGPRFASRHKLGKQQFFNHAFGIGWVVHELVHRWSAYLQYPGEDPNLLLEPSTHHHWRPTLIVPAAFPVWKLFSDRPYPEPSVMGGMVLNDLPDGRKQSAIAPQGAASGLSLLDLYAMGLAGGGEVPDVTYIELPSGQLRTLTAADIRRANPAPMDNQGKTLHVGFYLLHQDGRAPLKHKLKLLRSIEQAMERYFEVATDRRIKIRASINTTKAAP